MAELVFEHIFLKIAICSDAPHEFINFINPAID